MGIVTQTKPIRIAFNMLCCAIFFCWAKPKPRETISGLFGRNFYYESGSKFWEYGCRLIDKIHRPHEDEHCLETAFLEGRARRALGYK